MDFRTVKYTEYEKNVYLNLLRGLNAAFDRSENLSDSQIKYFETALPDLISVLPINVEPVNSFSNPFERIVINRSICSENKRLTSLEQLRYPPLEIAYKLDYNRASKKGQSIFYGGSLGSLPVTIETNPQVGDLVTISKWKLKSNETLKLVVICQDQDVAYSNPEELLPIYNHYLDFLKQLDNNTRIVIEESYKFVIKAFTRKVKTTNRKGYIFSSLISDMLFNKMTIDVDAIYYPSVPNNGSCMNIAIKPKVVDNKFEMIKAKEQIYSVSPDSGANGWFSHATAECSKYHPESLELNWEDQHIDDNRAIQRLIREFNIKLK